MPTLRLLTPLQPKQTDEAQVLVIRPNENAVDIEADWTPRSAHEPAPPPACAHPSKPIRKRACDWLQQAWSRGRPGVLLADDMGLGKTLQALTFLAWLREGMQAGQVAAGAAADCRADRIAGELA